jgi:hypothetical protein
MGKFGMRKNPTRTAELFAAVSGILLPLATLAAARHLALPVKTLAQSDQKSVELST